MTHLNALKSATARSEGLMGYFFVCATQLIQKYADSVFYLDLLGAFVIECSMGWRTARQQDLCGVFLSSQIFREDWTIFNAGGDGFRAIDAMRNCAIQLILRQRDLDLPTRFFKHLSQTRLLFVEICERVIVNIDLFQELVATDPKILRMLAILRNSFAEDRLVQIALSRLIVASLSPPVQDSALSDQIFSMHFLGMVLNKEQRGPALQILEQYLIRLRDSIPAHIFHHIQNVIVQLVHLLPDPHAAENLAALFERLFAVFRAVSILARRFWFIVATLAETTAFDYVFEYMKYVPVLSAEENITSLCSALLRAPGIARDDSLYDKIMKLIVPHKDFIESPALVNVLLEYFWFDRKSRILKDLSVLCAVDTHNAIALHSCQFDLFLINCLLREFDFECLSFFREIAKVISSPNVVQHFISLFPPKQKRRIIDSLITFIEEILISNQSNPIATFDGGVNLNLVSLPECFVFSGWVFLESEQRFDLFDFGCPIYIQNHQLYIDIILLKELFLPLHQWFLLTIRFAPSFLQVFVNDTTHATLTMDLSFQEPCHFLPGAMGFGKAASFGLYEQLTVAQIAASFARGPRGTVPASKPILFWSPSDVAGYRTKLAIDVETLNFANVLLNVCRIDLLLPLFVETRIDC
jgi:hypothetical protein